MNRLALSLALASLGLTAACGGGSDDDAATSAPAAAPAPASPAPVGGAAGTGKGPVLTGIVGTDANPDAFEITLADAAGPVTSVPAGRYSIRIRDLSKIHNFHLEGAGVDESTTVPEVTETTFEVSLEAGSYTFVCDPHPGMKGELTVT